MKTKKSVIITLTSIFIILPVLAFAHPGKTDSRGGHRDNKNASKLGPYHFHCDGYPAHLHEGGICPYTDNNTSVNYNITESNIVEKDDKGNTQKRLDDFFNKSEKSEKETSEIKAESIKITANPDAPVRITNMRNIILSAKIYPENTTDKTVKWSVSDENIARINQNGKLTYKKDGKITITAETSNGIKDKMEIEFHLELKERIFIIIILTIFLIAFVIFEKKIAKKSENK